MRDLVQTGRWVIDPSRSRVGFSVRHALSTVNGTFGEFYGVLEAGEAGSVRARGSVRTASLDTGVAKRDEHLRARDFFDAEAHPEMRFASRSIEPLADGGHRIVGCLSIGAVTRAIELRVAAIDGGPSDRDVVLRIRGEVDRRAFGLVWAPAVELGSMVADCVRITLDLCAVHAVEELAA